jgi:hypothetical protein
MVQDRDAPAPTTSTVSRVACSTGTDAAVRGDEQAPDPHRRADAADDRIRATAQEGSS